MAKQKVEVFSQTVNGYTEHAREQARIEAEKVAQRAAQEKEARSAKARKAASARFYQQRKEEHQKVSIAMNQMLKQFVEETKGKPLIQFEDMRDELSIKRRREQMTIMRETMATLKQMRDFAAVLKEDSGLSKEKATPVGKENDKIINAQERFINKRIKTGTDS